MKGEILASSINKKRAFFLHDIARGRLNQVDRRELDHRVQGRKKRLARYKVAGCQKGEFPFAVSFP